ncbi:MAG: D-alanine--D-alanine ligase [Acidobacteria bacterium]|nr:D-alanine--D-alanine ligase [Acidobacteriota bacterium]
MRVALIFGGRSPEHAVSIVSASSVGRALDRERYEVLPMAIDRRGRWAAPEVSAAVLGAAAARPDEVPAFEGRDAVDPRLLDGSADIAFPVLHGAFGEDGTIQGMFEMLDLAYVGCGVAASAVCMDKGLTKRLIAAAGLPTARWVEIEAPGWRREPGATLERCQTLRFPVFVKPARLGSSVGISKVRAAAKLVEAIDLAFAHDDHVIVEEGIDGREIEVAVLGNENPRASAPGEVVPGHEFYDFSDKYLDDACTLLAPAPLDGEIADRARELAVRSYETLGCAGMARVDLFLERDRGRFLLNEVNTIPGFTPISMFPRLWDISGLAYPRLLDRLIELGWARHEARTKLETSG